MICRAITTLKKTDADGRVPAYTLDQYVRGELCQQLLHAINAGLTINRCDSETDSNSSTVDFSTELILLTTGQWQQLSSVLTRVSTLLPATEQTAVLQLMDELVPDC